MTRFFFTSLLFVMTAVGFGATDRASAATCVGNVSGEFNSAGTAAGKTSAACTTYGRTTPRSGAVAGIRG